MGENLIDLILGDTASRIFYVEIQLVISTTVAEQGATLSCELDGIVDKVRDDLGDTVTAST